MQQSIIFSLLLPAVLSVIMLGLGLALRLDDFRRILTDPKPVLTALACQTLVLPALCFVIVLMSDMPPAIAVGMMLLAASPGGSSSIIYTHVCGGDTALSITLTTINSFLSLLTLPIIVNASMVYFLGEGVSLPLQTGHILQIFALAVVPVLIGIAVRRKSPSLADRLDRPVRVMATAFLALVVAFAVATQLDVIITWGPSVALAAGAFNLVGLSIGYGVPRLMRLAPRQAIAISMEIGIHNAAYVITLAMSEYLLNQPVMAVPPAIYALIAYVTAGAMAWWYRRGARLAATAAG